MMEGLLCKEGLFVLFVADVLLYSGLFDTLSFLDVAAGGLEDGVHLWSQANIFGDWMPCTLVLIFPSTYLFILLSSGSSFE